MSEKENRKAKRRRSDLVVEVYDPESSMLIGVGRLLNLSVSGALIESDVRLTSGQTIRLRVRHKDHSNLELLCIIIDARGKGAAITYGLQFKRA